MNAIEARDRLDDLPDPAMLLSGDHRVLATNAAWRARYGEHVVPGESRCHLVSHGYGKPCDQEGESCPVRACRVTGRASHVTHVHRHGDHEEICDIELQPVADAGGEVVAFLEIVRPHRVAEHGLVGISSAFREVVSLVEQVAPTPVPVLLLGETGTGKERVAEAVHRASGRRDGPMVAVECPGVQEGLFESELFGHERGAFTGADRRREGLVDAARGGTLFLDEIGDLTLQTQVKLLRLIEAGTYRRVGSTEPLRADFRLIAATHRDLPAMVAAGTFRADLYYRLAVFPIHLPPLRDRNGDVVPLARSMLEGRATLTPSAAAFLDRWAWPGNLRELRNVLDRAVVLSRGGPIRPEHLPDELRARATASAPAAERAWPWGDEVLPLADVERRYLAWAAERIPAREALAQALGLSLRQLYRRLSEIRR
ncbi:MAG: sigma 54-interacting transcriptional regulator [Alphaproteobacteria bacterium]|nr:sigma 54-interacting transcriptional regulator [Alphaproteobacteria bacterium]